ncbi:MAG TPA: ATP-binding cassette domain-containing protein, partial [Hyphomicrobiaceae bacterium]|nr:ATP-binding cassette domain-containing protein [Hyphomicrobiaceae bacterium]
MSEPLLDVKRVTKRFGGFTALDEVSVAIRPGERFGLVGPNGSGKTTLINCISGVLGLDKGTISFLGTDISALPTYMRTRRGIARSFQIPRPFRTMTVIENLMVALEFTAGHGHRETERQQEAIALIEQMGLGAKASRPSSELSQVELRKMELARAMAARPKLLISDEAMAGLSSAEIDEVLDLLIKLNQDGIAIIMIEHIMQA